MLYHAVYDLWSLDENAGVAEKIRFYRTKGGMNCDMLAEQVGLSRYAIMRYESEETEPTLEDLQKIAAALGIEADKLYDDYFRFLAYPYSDKIREVRRERKMTQREFGGLLGVTASAVKRWESGRCVVTRVVWELLREKKLL